MIIYIKKTKKQKSGQVNERKKRQKGQTDKQNTSHQMDDKNLKMPKSPSAIYQEDTH